MQDPINLINLKKMKIGFKGILPQKFYRPDLIFWIVMGCGKARFGQKGQNTPKIYNLVSKFVPWDLQATRT